MHSTNLNVLIVLLKSVSVYCRLQENKEYKLLLLQSSTLDRLYNQFLEQVKETDSELRRVLIILNGKIVHLQVAKVFSSN